MAVAMTMHWPGITSDQYDAVCEARPRTRTRLRRGAAHGDRHDEGVEV